MKNHKHFSQDSEYILLNFSYTIVVVHKVEVSHCFMYMYSELTHVVLVSAVPIMMAYVTRYIFGTDKLRPNAFEVRGLNGVSTGIIHCDDAAILSQWLKYITDNIVGLTNLQVLMIQTPFRFCSFVF